MEVAIFITDLFQINVKINTSTILRSILAQQNLKNVSSFCMYQWKENSKKRVNVYLCPTLEIFLTFCPKSR